MLPYCQRRIGCSKMNVLMRSSGILSLGIVFAKEFTPMWENSWTRVVLMMHGRCCSIHPHWFQPDNFIIDAAILCMCSWQIADTHQEFIYDFAASKAKCLFKKDYPFFFTFWMVVFDPLCERSV